MTSLAPPLSLQWTYPQALPDPVVVSDGVAVRLFRPRGVARLSGDGRLVWFRKASSDVIGLFSTGEFLLEEVAGPTPRGRRISLVDPESGRTVRSWGGDFSIRVVIDRGTVIGVRTEPEDSVNIVSRTLARLDLKQSGIGVAWEIHTSDARDKLGDADVWDTHVATHVGRLVLCRGARLVCVDLDSGRERWSAPMDPVGGGAEGGRQPVITGGRVIVNGLNGTMAVSLATGRRRWVSPVFGARTVAGRSIVFARAAAHGGELAVVDGATGRTTLAASIPAPSQRGRWGAFFTHPAVSDTHAFLGDDTGRLLALNRVTGIVEWSQRPQSISGFLAAVPRISGKRLYITSFSMDRRLPQALYCFEAAGEVRGVPKERVRRAPRRRTMQ